MSKFIEIKDIDGKIHFINVIHIEDVAKDEHGCTIFMVFNRPNAPVRDCYVTRESYEDITLRIAEGGDIV